MSRDALIVGINSYQYFNPPLKAPAKDAEAIAQRLEQDGEFRVWRVPEQIDQANGNRPAVSSTQQVSQVALKQALKRLFLPESKQAPETALFYFSGHGIPDEEGEDGYDKGYLAASDTNPNNPSSGISLGWLHWLLSKSPIKQQIIWLDCCHSGSLIVNVGAANPGNSESRDRCFIASSRDFETSWEDLNSPYSVLTRALLEGLEPSRLPGRWIDTFALVDYVNQALKGDLQTPICTHFGEAINLTKANYEQKTALVDPDTDILCPYKGLSYFDDNELDYQYFYGRRALTDELVNAVSTSNFVAIVGASGSGKSSVLRAGLLHQLRQGRISGSDQWDIRLMIPGTAPCQALSAVFVDVEANHLKRTAQLKEAEALLKDGADGLRRIVQTADTKRIVIVIDQFEEVFTLCQDNAKRQHFFNTLLGALVKTENKLCVVLAIRADFVGRCFEQNYSGLAKLTRDHMILVTPMLQAELVRAIETPAKQLGLRLEPELIQTLVKDVESSPGSLPLLQYTLTILWELRQKNILQLRTYVQIGGVTGTLKRQADEIYDGLNKAQQRIAKHIFLNLTQLGEGAEDTRRRISKDNLITTHHSATLVDEVIRRLTNANLVVTSELVSKENGSRTAIVEVAHEALIRNWPKLQQWLEENRTLLKQQRKIEQAALEWQAQGKPEEDYLLQGKQLSDAQNFQGKHGHDVPLSVLGNTYLEQSLWLEKNRDLLSLRRKIEQAALEWQAQGKPEEDYLLHGTQLFDAQNFQREHWHDLPLSVLGNEYIEKSLWLGKYQHLLSLRRKIEQAALEWQAQGKPEEGYLLHGTQLSDAQNLQSKYGDDVPLSVLGNEYIEKSLGQKKYQHLLSLRREIEQAAAKWQVHENPKGDYLLQGKQLSDAQHFRHEHVDMFPLSTVGIDYINESLKSQQAQWKKRAIVSVAAFIFLFIFSLAVISSIINFLRVRSDWQVVRSYDSETNIILRNSLVEALRNINAANYSLAKINLESADLRYGDFTNIDLEAVNLSYVDLKLTNLSNANLSNANLSNANLSNANLSNADLSNTNLIGANLSDTIILNVDLRITRGLTQNQLEGETSPFICNTPLPESIQIEGDKDRDCDRLPDLLHQRIDSEFGSLAEAEKFVKEHRQKNWE